MSTADRLENKLDLLCIATAEGALALPASEVRSVVDAPAEPHGLPFLDLVSLLGPGDPGAEKRAIRVAPPGASPFLLLTNGAIFVRTVARDELQRVPLWLEPLVASFGEPRLWLHDAALVLVVDAASLGALCALERVAALAAPAGERA